MQYIITAAIVIGLIGGWQFVIYLLIKQRRKGEELGVNKVVTHIVGRIKSHGEINLVLDNESITVIEKPKK